VNNVYFDATNDSRLILTDFNCSLVKERLGEGYHYKIIWAKEKDVTIKVDGYSVVIKKNNILFCTPFHIINVEPYTEGVISYIYNRRFYCIRDHDREVSCNGYLFYGSSTTLVKLNEKELKRFELFLSFFKEEFENIDNIQGEMLLVLLKRLLTFSTRVARKNMPEPEMPTSKLDLIRNFNILVEEHFRTKHKVSDYAKMLNKSPKSLSNFFLKYYNKSPHKVISDRICLEAERLLIFSNKNVSEIAYELEFSEASHFSKFFKNHTGNSPKEYKKQNH
jgi:AraC-like DNA-binding protein